MLVNEESQRMAERAPPSLRRPLPAKDELDCLQSRWAQNGMPFPRDRSVVDFFRDQARDRPRALAVKEGARFLTFGELDHLSNQVANYLLKAGLQCEDIVALPLSRSCAFVIAVLGVLKSGGSYLPIDSSTPMQRLLWFLDDAQSKFVITHPDFSNLRHGLREWDGQVLMLDENAKSLAGVSAVPPQIHSDPRRRAYVVYTSGSTGKPKGVEIEHHSLTNLICTLHEAFGLTSEDRGTLIFNIAFDASVIDLWSYLCVGGTLLIPPESLITDPNRLIQWLVAERVTFAALPTSLSHLVLTRPWPSDVALRFLRTGGETLQIRPPPNLPFLLINEYGPTENTVISTWTVVSPGSAADRPSIGRATGNVKVYVLNENGTPVLPGEQGELYVGGEQVARGYLNRPDLSGENFLPDPFANHEGARMYRTGDWVRLRPDGELDFLGRYDDQIQLRGRRVELGEIEQQILIYPRVRQAYCQPIFNGETATHIVAHVAVEGLQVRLSDALREHLRDRLPDYMVPAVFFFYKELPVTARGKIDREALQSIPPANLSNLESQFPIGTVERAIAELWFRVLPNAVEANCFATLHELGGDSLHAVELLVGMEKIVGKPLSISEILMEPTLSGLIHIATSESGHQDQLVLTLNTRHDRPPVFCMYGFHGEVIHYLALSKVLGEDQPVFGLRAPGLKDHDRLPKSMQEAGARALRSIQEIAPGQPPILIGYSWGGALAFEVARQWLLREKSAPFVAMIGARAPHRTRRPLSHRALHFFRWTPAWLLKKAREGSDHSVVEMGRRLFRFLMNDPVKTLLEFPESPWAPKMVTERLISIHDIYQPVVETPIEIHMFRETGDSVECPHPLDSSRTDYLSDFGWSYWARRAVEVHWIQADHYSILRPPAVNELGVKLRILLNRYHGVSC